MSQDALIEGYLDAGTAFAPGEEKQEAEDILPVSQQVILPPGSSYFGITVMLINPLCGQGFIPMQEREMI